MKTSTHIDGSKVTTLFCPLIIHVTEYLVHGFVLITTEIDLINIKMIVSFQFLGWFYIQYILFLGDIS
jgi:hypothetical protein